MGPSGLKGLYFLCCKILIQTGQKDLRLALELSETVSQTMPCVSAANELYKRAMGAGMADQDMASVYRIVNEPSNE